MAMIDHKDSLSIQKVLAEHGSRLAHYISARKELAACVDVDEVLAIADKSVAIRAYAAQVADRELENLAIRIRLRAERRCGELMVEEKAAGKLAKAGAPKGNKNNPAKSKSQTSSTVIFDSKKTLTDLGITLNQSSQMQKIAAVPEEKFEAIVESDTPSRTAVLKEAPKRTSKPRTKQPPTSETFHEQDVREDQREKKQPTARDAVQANAYKERMVTALGAMSGAVKGLTEVFEVTRIPSACTSAELREWVMEVDELSNSLSIFGTELVKELQRREDSEAYAPEGVAMPKEDILGANAKEVPVGGGVDPYADDSLPARYRADLAAVNEKIAARRERGKEPTERMLESKAFLEEIVARNVELFGN